MAIALLALLLACSAHRLPDPGEAFGVARGVVSEEPLADGTLPRPSTLDELRAAFPEGTRVHLQVIVPGQPVVEERWTFLSPTAEGVTIASETWIGGALAAPPAEGTTRWDELMEHAAFPADTSTRRAGRVTTPVGTHAAWVYDVRRVDEAGQPVLHHFWFARDLAGPPVLYTQERDGAEIFRMVMVLRDAGGG